jgi:alpha-mannosidase
VRNVICSEFRAATAFPHEKGGQSLVAHEFRYALCFHKGTWDSGNVIQESRKFNVPVRMAQTGAHSGTLPASHSFFNVEPAQLVLGAMKKSEKEDSVIIRLYNPTANTVRGTVTTALPVILARTTNLNEEPSGDLQVTNKRNILCDIPPGKIFTMEVKFNNA